MNAFIIEVFGERKEPGEPSVDSDCKVSVPAN